MTIALHPNLFGRLVSTARGHTPQEIIAAKAGITRRSVYALENGAGSLATLDAVLRALMVDVAGLPKGTTLGHRVGIARERRGWSIEEMSARTGLIPATIRRLEAHHPAAHVAGLSLMVDELGLDVRVSRALGATFEDGERDKRYTPLHIFDPIEAACGPFDLDPAASPDSPVRARRFFYREDDGLAQKWEGKVWLNPPYSNTAVWARKAFTEFDAGRCSGVVMLLRARMTGLLFQELQERADSLFLLAPIKFVGMNWRAAFPSALHVVGFDAATVDRLASAFPATYVGPRLKLAA